MRLIPYLAAIFCVATSTCSDHVFLGCVLRLKAQRVPFERNMLNVIFNIGTEARLLHTCRVYGSTLPCFREKVLECGDDKQRRMLNEVGKMLMFMCSPFSLQRQRMLVKHQKCVSGILALPATTGCKLEGHYHSNHLKSCRKRCNNDPSNFICLMKTWISEQNTCALKDIEERCGDEAGQFYKEMQTTVFEPSFPVLCEYDEIESTSVKAITSTNYTISKPSFKKIYNKKKIYKTFETTLPSTSTTPSTLSALPVSSETSLPARALPLQHVPVTAAPPSTVWTKKPAYGQSFLYSSELKTQLFQMPHYRQKPLDSSFPKLIEYSYTTSTPQPTPRSVKVINLLKTFLPGKLPAGLESFFYPSAAYPPYELTNDNSLEFLPVTSNIRKAPPKIAPIRTFGSLTTASSIVADTQIKGQMNIIKNSSTQQSTTTPIPSTINIQTSHTTRNMTATPPSQKTLQTTNSTPIRATEKNTFYMPPKSVRWKPWYLSGSDDYTPKL